MLVVRELLLGPKRFSDLRAGLPHASPNVLSQRLKDLEGSGLLRRITLGPPARVPAYELTDRGLELEPILIELSRWGSHLAHRPDDGMSTDAFMLLLKALYFPPAGSVFKAAIRLRTGGDVFTLALTPESIDITRSMTGPVDADIDGGVVALWDLIFSGERVPDALAAQRITIDGNRAAAAEFFTLFSVPPTRTAPVRELAG